MSATTTDTPLVHAVNVTKAFHGTEVLKGTLKGLPGFLATSATGLAGAGAARAKGVVSTS